MRRVTRAGSGRHIEREIAHLHKGRSDKLIVAGNPLPAISRECFLIFNQADCQYENAGQAGRPAKHDRTFALRAGTPMKRFIERQDRHESVR